MIIEKHTGMKRIVYAASYSYKGLKHNVINEAAFRQEVIAACVLIPLACVLDVSRVEQILLIAAVLIVMIVELLNTAVEAAVDRISLDYHELSGLAKDTGSAAVFIALVLAGLIWGGILI